MFTTLAQGCEQAEIISESDVDNALNFHYLFDISDNSTSRVFEGLFFEI